MDQLALRSHSGQRQSVRPEVSSPERQVGKDADTRKNRATNSFTTCAQASPAERVPLQDWDINWFGIPFGAWQWKQRAPTPKWATLSMARFWTVMANTLSKCGATIDLGRLCARLAIPLTKVKCTESGTVDVLNIGVGGEMVKMFCAP